MTPTGAVHTAPLSLPTAGGAITLEQVHTGGGRQLQGYATLQLVRGKKGNSPWIKQWVRFDTR